MEDRWGEKDIHTRRKKKCPKAQKSKKRMVKLGGNKHWVTVRSYIMVNIGRRERFI